MQQQKLTARQRKRRRQKANKAKEISRSKDKPSYGGLTKDEMQKALRSVLQTKTNRRTGATMREAKQRAENMGAKPRLS